VYTLGPAPTPDDVEALAGRTGVTRFPVRDGRQLRGYVHLKDVIGQPAGERRRPLSGPLIRPLPTVAANLALTDAIEVMRTNNAHLAQVRADGTDALLGIITLDDILARLVQPDASP